MSTAIGTVGTLWRYPVKSLAPQDLRIATIADDGIRGDRQSALFVHEGHARAGKTYRGKENNRLHLTSDAAQAVALAAEHGARVVLESRQPHHYDLGVFSILFSHWLDEISALAGYELEALRFRPNLFALTAPGLSLSEQQMHGMRLTIGTTQLRVSKSIERCVTPTYDLNTGEADPAILRSIAQQRANIAGIYCSVERPGSIALGDDIVADS